jgi:hypothetical protein
VKEESHTKMTFFSKTNLILIEENEDKEKLKTLKRTVLETAIENQE